MEKGNLNERRRFLRFAIVGISGTIIDFSIFNILTEAVGLPVIISSVGSFIAAVINNFIWNRNWTYPESRAKNLTEQLFKFSVVSVLGLIIRTPLFALLEKPMINVAKSLLINNFFISAEVIGHNIALASVIVVVLFWNYFINRIWTYKGIK